MDILPPELWEKIILYMNYDTIKKFRNLNNYTKDFCIKMRKLLVDLFSKDLMNTSNYNKQQHDFYEKVKLIKNRMIVAYTNDPYIIIRYNNYYITIHEKLSIREDLKYIEDAHIIIKLEIENILHLKYNINNPNCLDEINHFEYGIDKLNGQNHGLPFNLLQLYTDLYLSEDGDVYSFIDYENRMNKMTKINGLDKIRQIIDRYELLSINGDIYKSLEHDNIFILDERFKNIIKVNIKSDGPYDCIWYYLDNKGNITIVNENNTYYSVIETGKNIIEIINIDNFLCALDDNMKLYIYYYENFIKEYDLLNL
jgi:hypothetical protein